MRCFQTNKTAYIQDSNWVYIRVQLLLRARLAVRAMGVWEVDDIVFKKWYILARPLLMECIENEKLAFSSDKQFCSMLACN